MIYKYMRHQLYQNTIVEYNTANKGSQAMKLKLAGF